MPENFLREFSGKSDPATLFSPEVTVKFLFYYAFAVSGFILNNSLHLAKVFLSVMVILL